MEIGAVEADHVVEPLEDPVPAEPDEPPTIEEPDLAGLPLPA